MPKTRKRTKAPKSEFKFKVVTFGNGEGQPASIPLRSGGAPLPFIVSSIDNRLQDPETQTLIRKHVMHDRVKKVKKQTMYTSANIREIQPRTAAELRDFTALRKTLTDGNLRRISEITGNVLRTVEEMVMDRFGGDIVVDRTPSPRTILGAGRVDP